MAFLGVKLLPIEAIMTKPMAAHCNKVSCSLKNNQTSQRGYRWL
jgi:hypothetical protein